MKCNRLVFMWALVFGVSLIPSRSLVAQPVEHNPAQKDDDDKPVDPARLHDPALWHDPGTISELDLLYGQGGKEGAPVSPFKFQEEDLHGTNPKFDVRDARGTKWRVKIM